MTATAAPSKRRKPASGQQLWALNKIGRLGLALDQDGLAWADTCWQLLASAEKDGAWKPKQPAYAGREKESA